MSRGFLTMAVGEVRYLEMAVDMALSLREHSRLPIALATDSRLGSQAKARYADVFDEIVSVERRFLDGRALKYGSAAASPFDETVFVDADCIVLDALDHLFDLLGEADVAMVGERLSRGDRRHHHGFPTPMLIERFGLDSYLKTNSGLFCFRKPAALEVMDECLRCYTDEIRPAFRWSWMLGRWVGDEIAFGVVGARRGLGILPHQSMYWPHEIDRLDPRDPIKPLLHLIWPPPSRALETLLAGTVARRLQHGLPAVPARHWQVKARKLRWMALRVRFLERFAWMGVG